MHQKWGEIYAGERSILLMSFKKKNAVLVLVLQFCKKFMLVYARKLCLRESGVQEKILRLNAKEGPVFKGSYI